MMHLRTHTHTHIPLAGLGSSWYQSADSAHREVVVQRSYFLPIMWLKWGIALPSGFRSPHCWLPVLHCVERGCLGAIWCRWLLSLHCALPWVCCWLMRYARSFSMLLPFAIHLGWNLDAELCFRIIPMGSHVLLTGWSLPSCCYHFISGTWCNVVCCQGLGYWL